MPLLVCARWRPVRACCAGSLLVRVAFQLNHARPACSDLRL